MGALAHSPGILLACALLAASVLSSYALAARFLSREGPAVRLSATAVIAYWMLDALFVVLAATGMFRGWAAATCLGTICLLTRATGRGMRADLAAGGAVLARALRSSLAIPILAGSGIVAARLGRALVAPPLIWDALTYHLFKAGRWVQGAGLAPVAAPNSWGYYEHFPHGGDSLWAWTMLPVGGDGLLAWSNLAVWLTCVLAVYTLARQLGSNEEMALLASLLTCFTPAVVNYLTACHVENVSLALFALASVFLIRVLASAHPADAALAGGALGAAAAVKVPNLALAGAGLAVLIYGLARVRKAGRPAAGAAMAALMAACIAAPTYLTTWGLAGSPIYPFDLTLGGHTLLRGDPTFTSVMAAETLVPGGPAFNLLRNLFLPLPVNFEERGVFLNLGPSIALLLVPALLGLKQLGSLRKPPAISVYLVTCSALIVATLLLPGAAAQRTAFAGFAGRFLIIPAAVTTVLASLCRFRGVRALLFAGLILNLLLGIPLGWGPPDAGALVRFAKWIPPVAAMGALAYLAGRTRSLRWLRPAGAACALLVFLMGAERIRDDSRYQYYASVAAGESFDVGTGVERILQAWPAWRFLDRPSSLRIALAAGWNGMSPMTARYPFLGSRLQNEVLYLSVLEGDAVSTKPEEYGHPSGADFEGWLGRIVDRRVDYLVLLPPGSIEGSWVAEHEPIFRLEFTVEGVVAVYAVQRGAATELLDGTRQGAYF